MTCDPCLSGKKVLVTGGTGSFGHMIVSRLLQLPVEEVTVYSRDEEKQWSMKREFPDKRMRWVVGDVRDPRRLLEWTRVDIVFHAAALKIVPTIEECPLEATKTNVWGTHYVREACIQNRVSKAILISTDKAVKPVNSYGMTKALAERVWLDSAPALDTTFSIVRYGNVIGSRGSVVPYFWERIKQSQALPLTDILMSRFLLTLEQAIDLVFHAVLTMKGNEIFIPKNPACRMVNLAEAMAGKEYPIDIVGIRSGEKIAEILLSEEEIRRTEETPDCFIVHPFGGYEGTMNEEFTSENAKQLGIAEIHQLLSEAGYPCN